LDRQSKNELRIFKKFAEVCPYSIVFDSIEKLQPPEPDILCRLSDGEEITFELVECIDNSLARSIYDSCKLRKAFDDEIDKLSKLEKMQIKTKFSNVMISIVFHKKISLINKLNSINIVFSQLWSKENEEKIAEMKEYLSFLNPKRSKLFWNILTKWNISEDELLKQAPFNKSVPKEFDLKLPNNLKDVVKRITFVVFPGPSSEGPSFNITEAVWFNNPVEKQIGKKLNKKYKNNCPVELLVYYELQPELQTEYWILPSMDSVVEGLEKSVFRRVWLYSATQNKVIYVFPDF